MNEGGKGDQPRKVDQSKFAEGWDKIFGKVSLGGLTIDTLTEFKEWDPDSHMLAIEEHTHATRAKNDAQLAHEQKVFGTHDYYTAYGGGGKVDSTTQPQETKEKRMIHTTNFELAGDFMEAYGQDIPVAPKWPDQKIQNLRLALIDEEVGELRQAIQDKDMVEVADALTDILYVVYGAGHAFGIDLDECYNEVHRSNLTKLGEDGYPMKDEDGKVMKGPNYEEPDLEQFLHGFPERFS